MFSSVSMEINCALTEHKRGTCFSYSTGAWLSDLNSNASQGETNTREQVNIIIIMEICKVPTLRLKALNKHTHIMHIKMENVIPKKNRSIYRQVFKHNYAKDAHAHTHTHTHTL